MSESEVMIRPIGALQARRGRTGEPDRPAIDAAEADRGRLALILGRFGGPAGRSRACAASGLVARNGAPCRGFRADSRIRDMLP